MEIKKIAMLSEDEATALVGAGKVLRGLSDAYLAKEIDEFDENAINLFKALKEVLNTVTRD